MSGSTVTKYFSAPGLPTSLRVGMTAPAYLASDGLDSTNDALVNLIDGTAVTGELGIGWCHDPRSGCIGDFLRAFYPSTYPVPTGWFTGVFGVIDTHYACAHPIMPVSC